MQRRFRFLLLIMSIPLSLFAFVGGVAALECYEAQYPEEIACLKAAGWEEAVASMRVRFSSLEPASNSRPMAAEVETFAPAGAVDSSVYGRIQYGKLADNAIVYAEPSRGAAQVRNVGDGFLYATVNYWQEVGDETWYQINQGEYVHEDDFRLVQASDFQGVVVKEQPQRPFGWIVQDITPSDRPDGEPNETFEEMPRFTFFEVYDAVMGDEDWIWYKVGDGQWIRQTSVSLVDVSPRPEGVGPADFWTEVDLYEQTFAAYEGDQMVYATLISSGLNRWPTREGLHQVWDRYERYKMSGAEGQVDYYFIEDVPYIMYFDDLMGIALHGTYWHDRFGYKHSHGCVNMPILDAEWTYKWSTNTPEALYVWVHTSDPGESL